MKKIKELINAFKTRFSSTIIKEETRLSLQARIIYAAFALVAFVMSVLNIFTKQWPLLVATGAFFLLSTVNVLMTFRKSLEKKAMFMFAAELIILFSFFIITGGTDNFSIVWLLLLPSLGLYFFGREYGTLICIIIMCIMLACFYVPAISSFCTSYGSTWNLRFPVVFVATYAVSFLLETIRTALSKELRRQRNIINDQKNHDQLTGLKNRYALRELADNISGIPFEIFGATILDIDFFKKFNDNYGHYVGDEVLKELSSTVSEALPENASLYRWGGEEFVIIFSDGTNALEKSEFVMNTVRNATFHIGGKDFKITCSFGLATCDRETAANNFDALLIAADSYLYNAKQSGRNCIKYGKI